VTLYDLVSKAQYMQVFSIYLTNAYDQNIPIARGTRTEMIAMDAEENEEDFFRHLMCEVEYFHITDKRIMVVFIRDEHFEDRASYNYSDEYVKRWDNFNPKTRPWLHGIETEEYTDKYLWKFAGYKIDEDVNADEET
jgi:hypothetical protein